MGNMDIYEKYRSVPEEAKKKINGGRISGMTDINPMWRIKSLTEAFGPCGIGWYYKPIRKWTECVGDEIAAFVDIELYIRVEGEWSMPISGTGGSRLATKERSGVYVSDECYKMATTDALSVACKNLGFGADVYFEKDVTKYATPDVPQPKTIGEKEMAIIRKEMERTGITEKTILSTFNIRTLSAMTLEDYGSCLIRFKATQDKPVPCPSDPEEPVITEQLPWD